MSRSPTTETFRALAAEGFAGLMGAHALEKPDGVYAVINDVPLTFGALDRQASAFAATLASSGIAAGDRVAVMLRNSAASLAVIFGLAKAGITWVPINVRQRGDGLGYLLAHAKPKLLVIESDLVTLAEESFGSRAPIEMLVSGEADERAPLQAALQSGRHFDESIVSADATAAIMYTSGTTGPPKGVIVSHSMFRLAAEGAGQASMARPNDVFFVWEPLYHIGGAQLILLPMTHGVKLAMVERFSATRFWQRGGGGGRHPHPLSGRDPADSPEPAARSTGPCPSRSRRVGRWLPATRMEGVRGAIRRQDS